MNAYWQMLVSYVQQIPWVSIADSLQWFFMAYFVAINLAYLLLNFEMAQQRFAWSYGLVPCALAYVGGVAVWHDRPEQIPLALGAANLVALGLLVAGIRAQRRRR